jgi:hypothetical protein
MFCNLQAFFGPSKLPDITAFKVEVYQQARVNDACAATSNREMAVLKHV